ncbi:hypothetical protein IQ22_04206 [Pseudomonas duriflava]|uniref:Uncharacterized protein n=1 Tax=Pseudomonas duriflava TaxID=459528 RepID=A0A562PUH6_9PSED|nr:hypothetical protein [Pseudomonas duriflava]TWI48013.1 hypothetical protein IQ22_04206 [Pseudomonas duriflava]
MHWILIVVSTAAKQPVVSMPELAHAWPVKTPRKNHLNDEQQSQYPLHFKRRNGCPRRPLKQVPSFCSRSVKQGTDWTMSVSKNQKQRFAYC